jgi:Ca-activated chloride channel homolog
LDVSVKDRDGRFVDGLNKGNFRAFEDGRERAITVFGAEDAPATVGLVVDNSGSMRFRRAEVAVAGLAFVKTSNPKDQFFVVNFNDEVQFGLPAEVPFTDRIDLLRAALYRGRLIGRTAMNDAIASSLRHLELSHSERRTLVVVSDGGDNASEVQWAQLERMIQESRATIFTVGLLDPYDRDRNPKLLRKLADISGGTFYAPASVDEVASSFDKIAKEIRRRYTIGFAPNRQGDDREIHKIKLIARDSSGRKLTVRTRTSFSIPRPSGPVVRQ